MKKYIAIGISLAVALSLTACGHPTQGQQLPAESQEVQQVGPVETETTPQTVDVQQTEDVPQEVPPVGEEEPPLEEEAQDIEEETGAVEEVGTVNEVGTVEEADIVDEAGPVEETVPDEEAVPSVEVQLFEDCNEMVYATGTVNIRGSWSVSSDKVGSLSVGDSVTRTGTSIAGTEAEGWSRVTLSDGTTAYIHNSYLSTTKPAAPSTSNNTQTNSDTNTTTQQQTSTQNRENWDQAFYETLTPEQQAVYEELDPSSRNQMQQNIEKTRIAEEAGWAVDHGDPTDEQLAEFWTNMLGQP